MSISVQIKGVVARRMNIGQGFISNDPDREKKKPKTVAGRKLSKVKTNKHLIYEISNQAEEKKIFKNGLCKIS